MELFFPRACGGCGAPGASLCSDCQRVWRKPPTLARLDLDLPVWTLSPYDGPHRNVLIALKEHGRADLVAFVGAVVGASISYLAAQGKLSTTSRWFRRPPAPPRDAGGAAIRLSGCAMHHAYRRFPAFKSHPAHQTPSVKLRNSEDSICEWS